MLGRRTYGQSGMGRSDPRNQDGKSSSSTLQLGLIPPSSKRSKNNDGDDSSEDEDAGLFNEEDDEQTPARVLNKNASTPARIPST